MRQPFCIHYGKCLDRAAKQNSDFCCARCRFRRTYQDIPASDFEGCLLLALAVIQPERYQKLYEHLRRQDQEPGSKFEYMPEHSLPRGEAFSLWY